MFFPFCYVLETPDCNPPGTHVANGRGIQPPVPLSLPLPLKMVTCTCRGICLCMFASVLQCVDLFICVDLCHVSGGGVVGRNSHYLKSSTVVFFLICKAPACNLFSSHVARGRGVQPPVPLLQRQAPAALGTQVPPLFLNSNISI